MQRLGPWLDDASGLGSEHRLFDGAPFASAWVSINRATREGRNPSTNHNRIHLCGAGAGLTGEGLDALLAMMQDEGIDTFFIRLTPGPGMDHARALIRAAGFERHPWTRYPVLALAEAARPAMATDLTVRSVDRAGALAAREAMGTAMWPGFLASAGAPGFHHFLAFDGERPVAHAAMALREGIAYLGWMSTAEAARRRGAQQALIAARVALARDLGADHIVTEALTILASSRANLERAGFHEVYERETYGRMRS